jgi:membrane protein implicated in regulation of membrane protease activity
MNIENEFFNVILSHMAIAWIILAIIFALIEGITLGMVTIWFTIGSIISAVVALIGGSPTVQIVVFFVVSLVLLIFTRPIFVKHLKIGREKNVIEQIEGRIGIVTQAIQPFNSGLVKVNGITWTAIGEDPDSAIDKGTEVQIIKVQGVKLIVALPENE